MKPPNGTEIEKIQRYLEANGCPLPTGMKHIIHRLCNYAQNTEPKLRELRQFGARVNSALGVEEGEP